MVGFGLDLTFELWHFDFSSLWYTFVMTKLIVGLGNPGPEYEKTRHNIGFIAADRLAGRLKAPWELDAACTAEVAQAKLRKDRIIIAKPQTMMNGSGKSVRALIRKYKARSEHITVIHDEIDIEEGKFKRSFGRNSAGHRGVESIIKALKTKDFWRLRIGIHPKGAKKKVDAIKLILAPLKPAEAKALNNVLNEALAQLTQ